MEYEIHKALWNEKEEIVEFLNREWKKSQMINENKMFEFYFKNGNDLQFVIAKRKNNSQIVGACGYFLSSKDDVWLSNTCVKKGESPFIIFQIIEYFKNIAPNIHDVNCTDKMKRIFKLAGFQTGEYIHFFRLVKEKNHEIIQIPSKIKMPSIYDYESNIKEINTFEDIKKIDYDFANLNPKKTVNYIWHRYKEFPYDEFEYRIWVTGYENNEALIITREQKVQNKAILRIVDIIGNEICLRSAMKHFVEMGKEKDYEYIDCFCSGIPIETMRKCGFLSNVDRSCIIPDHFSPLIRKNVTINYATNNYNGFRSFKADGDMDRPNLWR